MRPSLRPRHSDHHHREVPIVAAISRLLICVLLLLMASCSDSLSEKSEQTGILVEPSKSVPTSEPRILKFGNVTAHLDQRRIEVDVEFCLEEGILEYLAVAKDGKTYESVLVILCEPSELHMALLAIGCEPGDVPKEAKGDFVKESVEQSREKPTSRLDLFLEWSEQSKLFRLRAEELLFSIAQEQPAETTHWIFTGSYFSQDAKGRQRYAADVDRSVIAVWYDPSAVINLPVASGNPYRGPSGFSVNTNILPKSPKARLIILPRRSGVKPPNALE